MAEIPPSIAPAPMEGQGAYNRSSQVQAAGSLPALTLLERAARMVSLAPAPAPVVIADYGSSEGRNSLAPMAVALAALRPRIGPERAVSVIHTDLPGNEFTALFQLLAEDPDSYLRKDPEVFASAVGRSFYEQILPRESVTLGWSSWAVQWLSRVPAPIPDQVQAALSRDPATRAAYAAQAAEDWQEFLLHRAAELRPGGRLIVLTMALDEAGSFGYRAVMAAVYGALLDLVKQGLVGAAEARRMAVPTYARSREEFLTPFGGQGRFAGLSVEHLETFFGEDRIWAAFQRSGDAVAFGAHWAAFSRASIFPTMAAGLDGGGQDSRAGEFMARLEAGMAARLAAAPEPTVIPLAAMVIAREVG